MTENLFQHIWSGLYFKTTGLETTCGLDVSVIRQGRLNCSDGPDFREAELRIGGLTFFGDVELHLRPEEWFNHGHQKDPRYNQVVLHVVLSGRPGKPAMLADGTKVPCLILQPYISNALNDVLQYAGSRQEMACAGMLHLISPRVIEDQITKAHEAYFEFRINQLMAGFDPSLPSSLAWKRLLAVGLFEGLGYTQNTSQMAELCRLLFRFAAPEDNRQSVIRKAMLLSGLENSGGPLSGFMERSSWKFSASRPANQPPARILQASVIYFNILHNDPAISRIDVDHTELWKQLMHDAGTGGERKSLLFSTVYLPALHILGSLFHDKAIKDRSFTAWMNQQNKLPSSITGIYKKNGFPPGSYERKLGAVYQYKYRCREAGCESCFVMQKLLQA